MFRKTFRQRKKKKHAQERDNKAPTITVDYAITTYLKDKW